MKKYLLVVGACLFSTALFAQTVTEAQAKEVEETVSEVSQAQQLQQQNEQETQEVDVEQSIGPPDYLNL